ncbi:MAG: T9SS type A sorting domain-containing protein, partial [Flavobacteriales bacterium]|nr:T9SS type A sorting domain-containing protein [Flavobacteriales bacterium]
SSIAGNVLTWTSPQLVMNQVFQHNDISVRTQVPSDISLIGSTLSTTAQLVCANTDGNLANNTVTSDQLVTGSFDPNDKRATTSLGSSSAWLIDEDEWIDYTIRFQNTGTDTAFNVIITDTLPATLDPSSLTWGAGSHAHSRALIGQGVVKFIFPNILLPDSNANEALSHGFVSFRIRPRQPVPPGTVIENIANIYFDYNPPVITEPSVLVAESSTGESDPYGTAPLAVFPNPADDRLLFSYAERIALVRILTADGREAMRRTVRSNTAELVVGGLSCGAYVLVAELENGGTARTRFIKQ